MKTINTKALLLPLLVFVLCITGCSEQRIDGVRVGTISGVVVEKGTNKPVENVKITTNPSTTTTFTDAKGAFVLKDVLVKKYTVQAELTGYNEAFEGATVIEKGEVKVAFELTDKKSLNDPPSSPKLATPQDKAKNIANSNVVFTWSAKDPNPKDELEYTLELRNAKTNEVEVFETKKDTFYVMKDLKLATTYYWQVSVNDGVNKSVSSSLSEFSTLEYPNNPLVFIKKEGDNTVIYSGKRGTGTTNGSPDVDVDLLKLSPSEANCFRPRGNRVLKKIAFLRSVGGDTHLFTMDTNGENVKQVTSTIPVNGFRLDQVDYTWYNNGQYLLYPSFGKLYRVSPSGGGTTKVFETSDGSFISEVAVPQFNNNLVLIKTNDSKGYNVRIFTVNLSTGAEQNVIVENVNGAFGSIDITANADRVLYTRDVSGSQNDSYRRFESRIFLHKISDGSSEELDPGADAGYNLLDAKLSPSEGSVIYTKALNYFGANPEVFLFPIDGDVNEEVKLFTSASMPDWD